MVSAIPEEYTNESGVKLFNKWTFDGVVVTDVALEVLFLFPLFTFLDHQQLINPM
jgi:hypothetical protein